MWLQGVAQWHETEICKNEISHCGYYISLGQKKVISLILQNTSKKYVPRFYQLKAGHGAVEIYLTRIEIIETSKYWWFNKVIQLIEHLYSKCRK